MLASFLAETDPDQTWCVHLVLHEVLSFGDLLVTTRSNLSLRVLQLLLLGGRTSTEAWRRTLVYPSLLCGDDQTEKGKKVRV